VEIAGQRDAQKLIQAHATKFKKDLLTDNIVFQTTMDGRRQLRRWVPELDADGVRDLPPEDLRRFAFKMATGSGKTWVVAMAIVWARFHKQRVPGSELSTNFLIVAPNVIVYQRLERDFAANRIFYELPLIPPEWRGAFSQKVILRGERPALWQPVLTNSSSSTSLAIRSGRRRTPSRLCSARSPRRTSLPRASARCWSG
jgi:type III restriction enzyme